MRRVQKWWKNITTSLLPPLQLGARSFRSDAVLEALAKASQDRVPNLILYNYPSFSGAFSALFAHLFHSHLNLPCLTLPFSSIIPLRSLRFLFILILLLITICCDWLIEWSNHLIVAGLKICALKAFKGVISWIFLVLKGLQWSFWIELHASNVYLTSFRFVNFFYYLFWYFYEFC